MPGAFGPSRPEKEDRARDWRPLRTPHHPPHGFPRPGQALVWYHSALCPPGDWTPLRAAVSSSENQEECSSFPPALRVQRWLSGGPGGTMGAAGPPHPP